MQLQALRFTNRKQDKKKINFFSLFSFYIFQFCFSSNFWNFFFDQLFDLWTCILRSKFASRWFANMVFAWNMLEDASQHVCNANFIYSCWATNQIICIIFFAKISWNSCQTWDAKTSSMRIIPSNSIANYNFRFQVNTLKNWAKFLNKSFQKNFLKKS